MGAKTKERLPHLIPVQGAVVQAMEAAKEFYGSRNVIDLTLEEVEKSRDGTQWLITLGFYLPSKKPATALDEMFRQIKGVTYEKKYKLFIVDAKTAGLLR
jgi:hypothetical protein